MSLLGQPTDILHYLCTYLNHKTVIQVWHVSRRFKLIVGGRVPLTFTIKDVSKGLQLISLFKKVILETKKNNTLDDTSCIQLGKHLTTLNLIDNNTITDKGL